MVEVRQGRVRRVGGRAAEGREWRQRGRDIQMMFAGWRGLWRNVPMRGWERAQAMKQEAKAKLKASAQARREAEQKARNAAVDVEMRLIQDDLPNTAALQS